MTPELAYQMRAPIDERIHAIDAERDALEAIELALDNYLRAVGALLEQPAHGHAPADGAGATGEAESLGGLASPAAPIEAVGSDQPKEEGDAGGAVASEATAHGGSASLSSSPLVACPDCDKQVKPVGLGAHRRFAHGYTAAERPPTTCPECGEEIAQAKNLPRQRRLAHGPTAPVAEVPPKPKVESFLCARCTDKFPTKELLTAHYQRGHPPSGPPTKPVGEQPVVDRVAGVLVDA